MMERWANDNMTEKEMLMSIGACQNIQDIISMEFVEEEEINAEA